MTSPRARKRSTSGDEDVISTLQAILDREEHRRIRLRRAGLITVALALVVVIGAAVLLQGNASAADRAEAARNAAPAPAGPVTAVVAPVQPQVEVKAAATEAPVEPKSRLAKPQAKKPAAAKPAAASKLKTQRLKISIGTEGYEPSVVRAKSGQPIVLSVGRGEGCAAGFLIPRLGVEKDNSSGPVTVDLGRVPAGRYRFSCGMDMVSGTLVVK